LKFIQKSIDIHEFDKRLSRAMDLVEKANPISDQNARLIREFKEQCVTEGLGTKRITKYVYTIRTLAEILKKDFDKATRDDIELLVNQIEKRDVSAWTKHDYEVALKKFYKWLKGEGEKYPPEVSWIKTTLKQKDSLLPDEILTEDEIRRLVDSADSPHDKAFIITLYESGARIGEMGSMQIRDVEFEERYTSLKLKGKTGSRRVILVAATPYLNGWIQNHPARDDPSSPL